MALLKVLGRVEDEFWVVHPATKTYGNYKGSLRVMTPNGIQELRIKYDRDTYRYYVVYDRKRYYLTIVSYNSQFPNFAI